MLLSNTIVDFHLLYDGAVDIQIWALLTRSQCKVSDTQVTVKACGPLVKVKEWTNKLNFTFADIIPHNSITSSSFANTPVMDSSSSLGELLGYVFFFILHDTKNKMRDCGSYLLRSMAAASVRPAIWVPVLFSHHMLTVNSHEWKFLEIL